MDLDILYEKAIYRLVRLNKKYGKLGVYLSLIFNAIIRLFVSCDISVFCKLGKVKIPHAIGIVIGSTAVVEDGTVIMANVCIGSAFGDRRENNHKYAKIGKNCVLGANACIIGGVTIGDNCIIGAGAVITKDIPENSVVVGNNRILRQVEQREGKTGFNY